MNNCLDFKPAKCKNCYKCLRECPVKAIAVIDHQARIIDERCILCGTCTGVCPQNAKYVHSDIDVFAGLVKSRAKLIASVAPSFISSFGVSDFSVMKIALGKLGFADAEETSVGANVVVAKYDELLRTKTYKNFITSACPAVNKLIELYYPKALEYLARVDSPMVAHAKMLRERYGKDIKIVFIGPCIAKKREAKESGIIDAVLTYEELKTLLDTNGIVFNDIAKLTVTKPTVANKAKYFPISRGIIKSFNQLPPDYEYVAVDGVKKCTEILADIESLDGMFLELNACDYACVKGPCSLKDACSAIKANSDIRKYVNNDLNNSTLTQKVFKTDVDLTTVYTKERPLGMPVTEREIKAILAKTGKLKPEDELNCGACGYSTCREKAWAVANGFADVEMCVPYMRERAETMSYEIIENSPNGIIAVDFDLKIIEFSKQARRLLQITTDDLKGKDLVDFLNPTDFILAQKTPDKVYRQKMTLPGDKVAELSISVLNEHKVMFGIFIDITEQVDYNDKLNKMRLDTIGTTDEVIKKQMRVAQEIASLLGETTAETKVALLKLKKALTQTPEEDK